MIKLNAIAAIEQFEKFCARGRGHLVTIKRPDGESICHRTNIFIMTLSCNYKGKYSDGSIFGRVEFNADSEKGEINKILHETFSDMNKGMNEFDTPEKKDVFT